MKTVTTIQRGRKVTKIAEETDESKVTKTVILLLSGDKAKKVKTEQLSLLPTTLTITKIEKRSLGPNAVDVNGFQRFQYETSVTFKANREYNPQPNGSWKNHKFVKYQADITFEDSSDAQIKSFYRPKIVKKNLEVIA